MCVHKGDKLSGQLSILTSTLFAFFIQLFLQKHDHGEHVKLYVFFENVIRVVSPTFTFTSIMQQCFSSYLEHSKYITGVTSFDHSKKRIQIITSLLEIMIFQSFCYIFSAIVVDRYHHAIKFCFSIIFSYSLRENRTAVSTSSNPLHNSDLESPTTPIYGSIVPHYETERSVPAINSQGNLISAEHVTAYQRNGDKALDNLSFKIDVGEKVAVIGPNGCGKSTLFGVLAQTEKCILTGEPKIRNLPSLSHRWELLESKSIGYVPQFGGLIEFMKVNEIRRLYAKLKGCEDHEEGSILLPKYANYHVRYLSGGNKKKLAVELAFMGSTPLILLDEVTSGIDPISANTIVEFASSVNPDSGLMFSSHRMDECLALCSRVLMIRDGKLLFDGPSSQFLARYNRFFQVDLHGTAELSEFIIVDALKAVGVEISPIVRWTKYDGHVFRAVFSRQRLKFSILWGALQGLLCIDILPFVCHMKPGLKSRGFIFCYKFRETETDDILSGFC